MNTVNQGVRKLDAMQLVTGQPVYTEDIAPENCLVVKLLRSPHANAMVREIDTERAMRVPGMEAVFTWKDVPQNARRYTQAGQTAPVLCSPLIVHKEGDASYQPDAVEDGMTATHTEDELEAPTIERHRFRKKKKNHKGAYVLILLLVAAVAVCAALYFTGTYDFGLKPKETTTQAAKTEDTAQETTNYDRVITVKGTYLFYEGQEVDGVEGLIAAIKYEPAGSTFTVQDENANSNFLNNNVLSTLSLYKMNYKITHIVSSGLTSKNETTRPQTAKPTAAPTKSNDQ